MTPETLQRMREAAEGATPGTWEVIGETVYSLWTAPGATERNNRITVQPMTDWRAPESREANARHIALASPENVLALLDEVEKQRRVIAELTDALGERA